MRSLFFIQVFLIVWGAASATEAPYAAGTIPVALQKDVDVVVRMEQTRFEVTTGNEAIMHKRMVYTILNENGDKHATLVAGYDKLRKVDIIEGTLYDANGKLLRKLKAKEVQDFSAVQDISLIDDNRVKVHSFNHRDYPYTVAYELEYKFNHNYGFPDWIPLDSERMAVENSSFTLVTPQDYQQRYKAFNYKGDPVTTIEKNRKISTWKVENLSALKKPFAAPAWNEMTTAVFFSPSEFKMEGFKGNSSTWQDLGKFALTLNEGRDKLPEEMVQKVKQLTAGKTDQKEKVRVLYEYLQKNTRYISIQLGIGGLQPFEASFVAKNGYGDCKALSNYMYSLLKAAGIKSYYTLIRAGEEKEDKYLLEDFPSDNFNHIVVCVPTQTDTTWLECTNQTVPAGYMGGFTGNRRALLITEEGGKLVATPRYGLKENQQIRTIKGRLNEKGDLEATIHTTYGAMQQDDLHMLINQVSKDKVKEILNVALGLSTYNINTFSYKENKSPLPTIEEQLDLTINAYATITGKRLFITPNLLNKSTLKLSTDETRTHDIELSYAYKDVDSITIEIPDGFTVEALAPNTKLATKFGSYSYETRINGNQITCVRIQEQYTGRFPPADYQALVTYINTIAKVDQSRIVFVKKQ